MIAFIEKLQSFNTACRYSLFLISSLYETLSFLHATPAYTAILCTPRQQPIPAIRCISRSAFEESNEE